MKLVVTTYMGEPYIEKFRGLFDEIEFVGMTKIGRVLNEDELISSLEDADAVVVEFDPLTRRVLESCKKLKVIASVRGGAHANVDVQATIDLGIPMLFVPGRNKDTVADFTMGMLIAVARGLAKGHHLIKNRVITDAKNHVENGFCPVDINWVGSTPEKFAYLQYKGPTLSGKTLGIIGYGHIGKMMAQRALAFDMKVIAFDPFVAQQDVLQDVMMVDLDTLMSTADFITIHMPVNEGTRNLISAEKLSLMKPTAYMINAARAALMDYDKLIDMLQKREIAGAALDVYPVEPLPDDHPLLDLDNVVLTPHIAGCSLDPYERSYNYLLEDLANFFHGSPINHLYNPDSLKKK